MGALFNGFNDSSGELIHKAYNAVKQKAVKEVAIVNSETLDSLYKSGGNKFQTIEISGRNVHQKSDTSETNSP